MTWPTPDRSTDGWRSDERPGRNQTMTDANPAGPDSGGANPDNHPPRSDAVSIWTAGVDAVRAAPLVRRAVSIAGDEMTVADHRWSRGDFDRIRLVGAGKAATAMAEGFLDAVGSWLPVRGWINVPTGTEKPLPGVEVHPARPAGVNE